ncbi:MAG: hypothetical protein P8Z30_16545 [Acidobacteriota bacterium]
MIKHTFQSLLVACLVTGTLLAARDPFVGKWKLNQAKSKITGEQLKIEDHGGNKYTFTFGKISDTLVADGTDQPIHFGQTESITPEGPNTWKRVVKKDGRILVTSTWAIAPDGKTMNIEGVVNRPDGSTSNEHVVVKRVAGTKGFAGTWQSTELKIGSPAEQEIRTYDGNGLSFITPAAHETLSMKFDGENYEARGPNVAPGSASSGRRINQHTLEVTDTVKGEVLDTVQYKVSPDNKTMTLTIHEMGQPSPLKIVYDREE